MFSFATTQKIVVWAPIAFVFPKILDTMVAIFLILASNCPVMSVKIIPKCNIKHGKAKQKIAQDFISLPVSFHPILEVL